MKKATVLSWLTGNADSGGISFLNVRILMVKVMKKMKLEQILGGGGEEVNF